MLDVNAFCQLLKDVDLESALYVGSATAAGSFLLWQLLKVRFPYVLEDLSFLKVLIKSLMTFKHNVKNDVLLYDGIARNAKKTPHKDFVLFEDERWTYGQMHQSVNRHARAFNRLGLKPFDKIALMMMNEPGFISSWAGASANGVTTAFINYQLRAKSLMHCLSLAEAKVLLISTSPAIISAIRAIRSELDAAGITVYTYTTVEGCEFEGFLPLTEKESDEDIPRDWRGSFTCKDPTCYIYTSGTTGLPKAVNFTSAKAWKAGALGHCFNMNSSDVMYTPLPLYHASAAGLGLHMTLVFGATIALREKFSASQFWPDCRRYSVTVVQYIGETMRYVMAQPPSKDDRDHSVRVALGNGLRPDVWRELIDRHGNQIHVCELYAATEGNIGFINVFNKFGCVGCLTPLYQALTGAYIIKFDAEAEEIVRDSNGRAIEVGWNEPGLVVGKIKKNFEMSSYKGAKQLTEKKVLCDLFKNGDKYFNTGDLMMRGEDYSMYFCDRVGDTFRWKGENVSTNEVSDTLGGDCQVYMANVYGVEVPGNEGRAGMAAVILKSDVSAFDGKSLYEHSKNQLPAYARPVFIRIEGDLEITGTFKMKKVALKAQGFDPAKCPAGSTLYVADHNVKAFVPMTSAIFAGIQSGKIRV